MTTGADPSSIAIIPARGGSARIPRKNIRRFEGRPIIAYTIQSALQCGLFHEIMVSTEDQEIADVARQSGAAVPFMRSLHNSSDHATTVAVLIEVLAEYEARGRRFQYGCCLYPTAPFVTPELLSQGHRLLVDGAFDSVFPVIRYAHPIQRALRLEDGMVRMMWPEHRETRTQDVPPTYHDAGQFYWFVVDALRRHERLLTDNSGAMVLSEMEAHDIDTADDWSVAEFKYRFGRPRRPGQADRG
jgi:N-acylneuraminate cytidylyltransferase